MNALYKERLYSLPFGRQTNNVLCNEPQPPLKQSYVLHLEMKNGNEKFSHHPFSFLHINFPTDGVDQGLAFSVARRAYHNTCSKRNRVQSSGPPLPQLHRLRSNLQPFPSFRSSWFFRSDTRTVVIKREKKFSRGMFQVLLSFTCPYHAPDSSSLSA